MVNLLTSIIPINPIKLLKKFKGFNFIYLKKYYIKKLNY